MHLWLLKVIVRLYQAFKNITNYLSITYLCHPSTDCILKMEVPTVA